MLWVANGQNLAGSISVTNNEVGQLTNFEFELFIINYDIARGDYLEVALPDYNDARFEDSTDLDCNVDNAVVSQCLIVNDLQARIYFGTDFLLDSLNGYISNFRNPVSIKDQSGIDLSIYDEDGGKKVNSLISILANFQLTGITASFTSSSDVVGETGLILTVDITPDTVLAAEGRIYI